MSSFNMIKSSEQVFQRKFPKNQDEDAKDTWVGIWG